MGNYTKNNFQKLKSYLLSWVINQQKLSLRTFLSGWLFTILVGREPEYIIKAENLKQNILHAQKMNTVSLFRGYSQLKNEGNYRGKIKLQNDTRQVLPHKSIISPQKSNVIEFYCAKTKLKLQSIENQCALTVATLGKRIKCHRNCKGWDKWKSNYQFSF